MAKRAGNTSTGEGVKGKKVRTTSDDAGGKFVSEKSKSTGGKCRTNGLKTIILSSSSGGVTKRLPDQNGRDTSNSK